MRLITKGQEPQQLSTWKKAHPNGRYQDLDSNEQGKQTRQAIRHAAIKEQFYLCAYCCKAINGTNSNNEHITSQHSAPNKSLDFANIVASCSTTNRCNQQRGSQILPLTPLMPECETELQFYLSGKVIGTTDRAIQAIEVLALDTRAIREERKQMVDSLVFGNGMTPDELEPPDNDLLSILLTDLQQPNQDDKLPPFSPVLVNIIGQLLPKH